MYTLNVLVVIFTVYFDAENVQNVSQTYYDENNNQPLVHAVLFFIKLNPFLVLLQKLSFPLVLKLTPVDESTLDAATAVQVEDPLNTGNETFINSYSASHDN